MIRWAKSASYNRLSHHPSSSLRRLCPWTKLRLNYLSINLICLITKAFGAFRCLLAFWCWYCKFCVAHTPNKLLWVSFNLRLVKCSTSHVLQRFLPVVCVTINIGAGQCCRLQPVCACMMQWRCSLTRVPSRPSIALHHHLANFP